MLYQKIHLVKNSLKISLKEENMYNIFFDWHKVKYIYLSKCLLKSAFKN